ncbi:hypothetical protein BDD12DRAFT_697587, partial [Trichophaea hybrida]
MLLLLALSLFVCQTTAALVSTFDNCLPQPARDSPTRLQFHPILVAADFDSKSKELTITVWGATTGKSGTNPSGRRKARRGLGGVDGLWVRDWDKGNRKEGDEGEGLGHVDYWSEQSVDSLRKRQLNVVPQANTSQASTIYFGKMYNSAYRFPDPSINYTYNGSIVDRDPSWQYATKFSTSIVLASFLVFRNDTFFCENPNNSLGARCPFGNRISLDNATSPDSAVQMDRHLGPPESRNDVAYLTNELPSFTWKRQLTSSYQFASLGVTFKITSGDQEATNVGCIHIEVTPEIQKGYNTALTWLSAGILIFVGIATILASALNPWNGTTDVFKFSSNFGMDEDMLRLVTPGFADCLQWLQFMVLTGSLSLSYPGFYQPIISNGAWSVLLLNTSLYSQAPIKANAWRADGVYVFQAWAYGYERLAQAVGLLTADDILVSVLAYFAVLMLGAVVIFQLWFWGRWAFWKLTGVEEGDLTSRNWPFTAGLVSRFAFTYFLLPVVTVCTFQFTIADHSATALTAIACIVLITILAFCGLLCYLIWTHNPASELFDDLPTLLIHGTLYNTHREKHLRYFIVPISMNILRGITFGALQPSGIAQITILAACEIVTILAVYGIKPYARATSMNLWHFIFSVVRLLTILLMMAFVPSINATDAVKGWTGWVILGIHAVVLLFGFVLKALQTLLELIVRGYSTDEEAARGGFAKVFGVRQLSRRKRHSQQTHGSTPTPIAAERKHTFTTVSTRHPHSRTNSSAAVLLGSPATEHTGIIVQPADRSPSGHVHSNSGSMAAGGFTPPTPARPGGYGYIPPVDAAVGPFYRPPRTRRVEGDQYSPARQSRGSWTSDLWGKPNRSSQGSLPPHVPIPQDGDPQPDPEWDAGRGTPTSAPAGASHRYTDSAVTVGSGRGNTDYAVREVDFYYGVRGPALSAQSQRRLGTGPADPTGPVITAKSWIKQKLGLARGEKEKGFSVVRSSRNPDAILDAQRDVAEERAGGAGGEDAEIGMAMTSPDEHQPIPQSPATESDYSDHEENDRELSSRMIEKR